MELHVFWLRENKQGNNERTVYNIIGCTIQVLYSHKVPKVVYSHISGSIRSSNLADPHPLIRGCGSATLLDRIDIEHGSDPFVVWLLHVLQHEYFFR